MKSNARLSSNAGNHTILKRVFEYPVGASKELKTVKMFEVNSNSKCNLSN
jgi:hypothetical protein